MRGTPHITTSTLSILHPSRGYGAGGTHTRAFNTNTTRASGGLTPALTLTHSRIKFNQGAFNSLGSMLWLNLIRKWVNT